MGKNQPGEGHPWGTGKPGENRKGNNGRHMLGIGVGVGCSSFGPTNWENVHKPVITGRGQGKEG